MISTAERRAGANPRRLTPRPPLCPMWDRADGGKGEVVTKSTGRGRGGTGPGVTWVAVGEGGKPISAPPLPAAGISPNRLGHLGMRTRYPCGLLFGRAVNPIFAPPPASLEMPAPVSHKDLSATGWLAYGKRHAVAPT
jgi:hypothetical protein